MKKFLIFIGLLLTANLFCQEALKSLEEDYYDYLSLTGLVERPYLGYRTLSDSEWNIDENTAINHPWKANNLGSKKILWEGKNQNTNWFLNGINQNISFKIFGPLWFNSYNTVHPYGQNDGALWQGAGYNTAFSFGAHLEAFGLNFTFKPQISFSQNKYFEIMTGVNGNPYSYYTGGIDLVQRYGEDAFFNFDAGDSEIRYNFYNFTLGFGTENPWIGPAYLNPMLGSNNAGSYPKFDIGLKKTSIYLPWNNFYLGEAEARAWIGKLSESEYFDGNSSNDKRMLNALTVSASPSFIPGFTFGANRIILTNWKTKNLKYFGRLFTFSRGNDVTGEGEDQKISLFFDYLFTPSGFEVFGEYGMDDFTSDISANPFHTGIYTLGIKQNIPLWKALEEKNIRSELIIECSNFEMSQDFQLQWQYGGYYCHGKIIQGYTQNGQILGAGSGYFGNSQFIKYSIFYPKGKTSLFIQRSCPNNNYIYNKAVTCDASYNSTTTTVYKDYYASFMTYFDFGVETSFFINNSLILGGEIVYDYIHNNLYQKKVLSTDADNDIKNNFHLEINIQYNL